ncbi:MAG TPA: c-type cytochrome [Actinomycetota bacterium]|jgi:mono/diheme cytochrome c family protein
MTVLAALSTGKAILIGVASGVVLALVAVAAMSGVRRPRRKSELDIPNAMKPGPSDPDLERPILEKLYAWGALLVLFMAIWVPVVWLREPTANTQDTDNFLEESIHRGYLTTLPGNEQNQLGFNCERCHGPGLHGGQNVFNGTVVPVPNLQTVCGGTASGHPLIKSLQDVVDTISQGRAGSDMPSWSVRFAGAMDDQQINDVVNYLLSIQKVPKEQNVCTNPAAASPTPTTSPTGGASPTPTASP